MEKGLGFKCLVNEIKDSFKYCYEDSEIYARELVDKCLVEMNKEYKEN